MMRRRKAKRRWLVLVGILCLLVFREELGITLSPAALGRFSEILERVRGKGTRPGAVDVTEKYVNMALVENEMARDFGAGSDGISAGNDGMSAESDRISAGSEGIIALTGSQREVVSVEDQRLNENQEETEALTDLICEVQADPVGIQKKLDISLESLKSYETLIKQFYLIDSTTMADAGLLNAERFMAKDLTVDKELPGPQILIYHTHSQEAFVDSAPGEESETVVGVGERLTEILQDTYGFQVYHHTATYDLPSRNGAYSKALPDVERILAENPTIQVVIDLHRDEMPKNMRLVTEIDGKPTARFMFFNGISRTKKTGEITYLKNDHLEENLAFSFQMEKAAQEYFPGLTRKIYLKGYRYNMHVCPKTLLIELGAQNNTLEEAMNACEPLAFLLDACLSPKNIVD